VRPRRTLSLVALASLPARSARADITTDYTNFKADLGKSVETFLLITGASLIADVTFTIHDVTLLRNGERQATGWAIAETVLTAPQAIFLDGALSYMHARGDDDDLIPIDILTVFPATWTTQLATHGIWSLASDRARLGDLYGVSWAIGANLTFTAGAISGAFGKRLGGPVFGVLEMIGTAPSIAVGIYRSVQPSEPDRGAWIALSAWSGTLFLHGLLSTVVPAPKKDEEDETATRHRLPFMFSPTVVSDGIRQTPGLAMRGVF
jgi:hypothetical protein